MKLPSFRLAALAASAVLLCILVPNHRVAAAINPQINFQGKLTNTDGTNVADGPYSIRFRIYTDPSADTGSCASTCKWEETQASVAVNGGLFNVQLGSSTTLPGSIDFNNSTLYLGIKVSTDAEMTPRVRLTASPYAFNSDLLDGMDSSAFVQLSSGNINIGSGTITSGLINGQTINSTSNFTGTLTVQGASSLTLGTASSNRGAVILKNAAGTNTVILQAPAINPTSSFSLTLPSALGSSGDCLKQNDGSGTLAFGSCSATSTTLQNAYDNSSSPATITTSAGGKGVKIIAGTLPTTHLLSIDNAGQAVTAADVNGLDINYVGGSAAVEAAGLRIDYTPGGTSGGVWSGLRIVANTTGAVSGVTEYGLKLEGPSSPGAGTEEAMYIGTGWDIGLDVQSGGLQLAAQTDPAAPAAGNLRIYAKDIAGRIFPKWIGPSGVDTPFQANLGFNRVSMIMPAGGTTLTTFVGGFGTTFTNTGTAANPTPATTNLMTSTRRATFSTGATAGTVASHRQSVLQVWRGNAAGKGGFFYTIRFATDTLASGNRAFVGMSDSVAAPTNVDPTTNTTPGKIGMAINASTGNWNFVNNVTGAAPTVTGLGASFPVNTTDLYELILYSAPNSSSIGWRVTNLSTGAQTSGSASSNIPSNTTFLAPQFWICNNATAAAAILDFSGWYLESDN
jgi:hypothetical protein